MPRYYFRLHANGQLQTKDSQGHEFANGKEACSHAVKLMPAALRKYAHSTGNTHLAVEISNGEHTLDVIRGKVFIESR
jgi:urease accessory protein UreE